MKICMESRTYLNHVLKTQGRAVISKKQENFMIKVVGNMKNECSIVYEILFRRTIVNVGTDGNLCIWQRCQGTEAVHITKKSFHVAADIRKELPKE